MKKLLTGVLGVALAGVLCLSPLAARAEEAAPAAKGGADLDSNITMKVRFDYDDRIRLDCPVPAFIEVSNRGPALDAVVRLRLDTDPPSAYEMPVQVEQGGTVEVTLPFFALGSVQNIEVTLTQGSKTLAVAEKNRALSYTQDKLVGILSGNPDGMAAYHSQIDTLAGAGSGVVHVSTVDLAAAEFPQQAPMLDRFALLILNHFDLTMLDDVQQQALVQWVHNGGRLLVDADAGGAQALRALGPVVELAAAGSFTDENAVEKLAAVSGYDYAWEQPLQGLGKVAPAGEIVAGTTASPLVTRHAAGAGQVFVTAFALDDPFLQKTRAPELFEAIPGLSAWTDNGADSGIISAAGGNMDAMMAAAGSIKWLDAPSLGWIVLVLLVFIVLAGPLAYFILARLDKRDWVWVTTPALAILFCVLVMGFGVGGHGSQVVSSVVSVVDSRAGQGAAQTYSLVGIGAPREGGYAVRLEEDGVPLPAAHSSYTVYSTASSSGAQQQAPALTFGMGGYPAPAFQNIRQWSMESFFLRRDIPMAGGLEAQVQYKADGSTHYTVKNSTGEDLEEVTLLTHLGYSHILLLAAGEERSGPLEGFSGGATMAVNGAYFPAGSSYYDLLQAYQSATATDLGSEEEQREAYLRTTMVNGLVGSSGLAARVASSRPSQQYTLPDSGVVWGWSRQLGQVALTVNDRQPKNELNRTMVLASAPIAYDSGALPALPTATVEGFVADAHDIVDGYAEVGEPAVWFMGGEVTYGFRVPDTVDPAGVEHLTIAPEHEYGKYEAFLYNYETDQWDPYQAGGLVKDGLAAAYIGPDRIVQLKITSPADGSGDYVSFDYPWLNITEKERGNA